MSIQKIVTHLGGETNIIIMCDICDFINTHTITSSTHRDNNVLTIDLGNLDAKKCMNCDTEYYFIYSR